MIRYIETLNENVSDSPGTQVSFDTTHAAIRKFVSIDRRAVHHVKLAAYTVFNEEGNILSGVRATYVQNTFTPVLTARIDLVTYMYCDRVNARLSPRDSRPEQRKCCSILEFEPFTMEIMRYTLLLHDYGAQCLPSQHTMSSLSRFSIAWTMKIYTYPSGGMNT